MSRGITRRLAYLCAALFFWQAALAPLAHAMAFHSAATISSGMQLQSAGEHGAREHEGMGHAGHEQNAVSEAPPCHGAEAVNSLPTDDAPEQANHEVDCCQSLGCDCACVHASASTCITLLPFSVIPDHPAVIAPSAPVQTVRVAELFRPPI